MPAENERHDPRADAAAAKQVASAGNDSRREAAAVCLLDDDPSVLKATGRLLRAAGWEAKTFTDPHAFLLHAHQHQPSVVVIDILMPAMNGLEVQTRLRDISPATRVIVLTSKDDPVVRARAMEGGASAFFTKPADNKELLSRIGAALDGK